MQVTPRRLRMGSAPARTEGAASGQSLAELDQICPEVDSFRLRLLCPGIGKHRQSEASSAECGLMSDKFDSSLPGIDPDLPELDQVWPETGQIWPDIGPIRPSHRPTLARTRPN